MGFYNEKHKSTDPMLDNWVTACYTLARSKHLLSNEEEETIMKIAKKIAHQTKYNF